jgi:uncharacterized protein YbjQ (UPF0145 family)
MLVLTIDHAPGHRIVAILGEVIGATVRPDNVYFEGVKTLDGGSNPNIDDIVRTRQAALIDMVERARVLGANAVVGLRFDHRTIGGKWSEICAYGTAMVLAQRRGIRSARGTRGGYEQASNGTVYDSAQGPVYDYDSSRSTR